MWIGSEWGRERERERGQTGVEWEWDSTGIDRIGVGGERVGIDSSSGVVGGREWGYTGVEEVRVGVGIDRSEVEG